MKAFGALVEENDDRGSTFPSSDADDLREGARFIPGLVTKARRAGKKVKFIQDCSNPNCWHWELQEPYQDNEPGTRIFHYAGETEHEECPECGNEHLGGEKVGPRDDFEMPVDLTDPLGYGVCPNCGNQLSRREARYPGRSAGSEYTEKFFSETCPGCGWTARSHGYGTKW